MRTCSNGAFKLQATILCLLSLPFLFACGGGEGNSDQALGSGSKEELPALCIWQGTPVREAPGKEGEWMTNLNVGESFTALNKTQKASTGDEKEEYRKIRLKGGDVGWSRSDLIAVDAKPGVLTEEAALHERPDAMARSESKKFSPLDVVARSKEEGDWVKVQGKRYGGKWIDEGWIKKAHLSHQKEDLTFAALYHQAKELEEKEKRKERLQELLNEEGDGGPLEKALRSRQSELLSE